MGLPSRRDQPSERLRSSETLVDEIDLLLICDTATASAHHLNQDDQFGPYSPTFWCSRICACSSLIRGECLHSCCCKLSRCTLKPNWSACAYRSEGADAANSLACSSAPPPPLFPATHKNGLWVGLDLSPVNWWNISDEESYFRRAICHIIVSKSKTRCS